MGFQIPCVHIIIIMITLSPLLLTWKFYVKALPRDLNHSNKNHIFHKPLISDGYIYAQSNSDKKEKVQKETMKARAQSQWLEYKAVKIKRSTQRTPPKTSNFIYTMTSNTAVQTGAAESRTEMENQQRQSLPSNDILSRNREKRTYQRTRRAAIIKRAADTEGKRQEPTNEQTVTKTDPQSEPEPEIEPEPKPTTGLQIVSETDLTSTPDDVTELGVVPVEIVTEPVIVEPTTEPTATKPEPQSEPEPEIETEPKPTTVLQIVSETDLTFTPDDVTELGVVPVEIVTEPVIVESTTEPTATKPEPEIEPEPKPTTVLQIVSETDLTSTPDDVTELGVVPVEIVTEPVIVEPTTELTVTQPEPQSEPESETETEPKPTTVLQIVSETDLTSTPDDVTELVVVPVEIVTEPVIVEPTTEPTVTEPEGVAIFAGSTGSFLSSSSPNVVSDSHLSISELPMETSVLYPRKPWYPVIKPGDDEFIDSESSHGKRLKPSIIRPGADDSPHAEPDIGPISFSRGLTVGLVLLAMLVLLLSIGLLLFLIWIRRHREPNVNSDLLSRLDRPPRTDRGGHPSYIAGSPTEGVRRPPGRVRSRPGRGEPNIGVTKPGVDSLASKSALRRRQQQHRRARLLAQDALLPEGSRATGSRFRCLSDDSTYYGTGSTRTDPVILTGARRTRVSVESGRRISTQPINGTDATDVTDGYATGDTYLEPPIALMDTERHMTTTDSEEVVSPAHISSSDGTCVSALEPSKISRNRGNAWKYIDEN